ncbi:acyl-CoA carboxylase subunit beta [Ramlibacter sp.]|uniref:acyl-CoA carboxylase subunit beta n=1 Tax=Ramlibacter sp. TaxID=1917967 RepID=UPI002D3F6C9B|nr:carboxyl transferase domain-containing protein [Ramlibacter sp.]HYD76583.1 carboxyl transferase domain-containing protein [Ramlibacter sp.]
MNAAASEFEANAGAYRTLLDSLQQARQQAWLGGPAAARDKHRQRGRVLVRDRIALLLDPGSPFLELGELAGEGMYEGVAPGAGIVTGVGLVQDRACMVIANDATVKGGTYFGMTCRKHVRAQRFARQHRLPCITLVDSGGAFLPDQANIFPDEGLFGSIFHNQVGMSAEGIAQIAVVLGACTAGGAYIPALCDEVVIVRGKGFLFLGGPQLVQAATGEVVDAEALGGADMHTRISGVTDHIAEDDGQAIAIARRLVGELPPMPPPLRDRVPVREPARPPTDVYGLVPRDPRQPAPTRDLLRCLLDGGELSEFKAGYGDTLVTGFARIGGWQVGVLANEGVLFVDSAVKATHFIDLCCKRNVPLLFLADVSGFMVGREAEQAGIAKAGAKFITAMSSASVPKFTLITGGAYGAGYLAMCGRAFQPNAMFMWPNGRAAIMGPEQAATTLALVKRQNLAAGETWSGADEEAFKAPIRRQYEDFAAARNFARHLWVDGILDPAETRPTLSLLLDLAARVPTPATRFGVFRM